MKMFEAKYRFVDYQGYRCSIWWNFMAKEGDQVKIAEDRELKKVEKHVTHMYGPGHVITCYSVEPLQAGFVTMRKSQVQVDHSNIPESLI